MKEEKKEIFVSKNIPIKNYDYKKITLKKLKNENNKTKYKNKHGLKLIIFLIDYIILSNLIIFTISLNDLLLLQLYFSKISLRIKGRITARVYYSGFYKKPNYVYVNNISKIPSYRYTLDQLDNHIELIWDDNLVSCYGLFYQCSTIYEIDFSEFNESLVENMEFMFYGCLSLISLNISNFKTSLVTTMSYMFMNCNLLKYLDLSSFNTGQVKNMIQMFSSCISLESLNISNFQTPKLKNIFAMFNDCPSLRLLDISNYDTSQVEDM